jgi:preprotein translocase subunit YajC
MKLNKDDRVVNVNGTPGTVVAIDNDAQPEAVKVQFDTGRAGWFSREDDKRLTPEDSH